MLKSHGNDSCFFLVRLIGSQRQRGMSDRTPSRGKGHVLRAMLKWLLYLESGNNRAFNVVIVFYMMSEWIGRGNRARGGTSITCKSDPICVYAVVVHKRLLACRLRLRRILICVATCALRPRETLHLLTFMFSQPTLELERP